MENLYSKFENSIPEKYKNDKIINYLYNLISYDTTKSEIECMKYIESAIKNELGGKVQFEKQPIGENGRYNLIVKSTQNPKILLGGHIDVVPVEDVSQFNPYIDGDKLYGRGAVDMKGGVAVLMDLLPNLVNNKKDFWMLFYCDEEYYFKGMKKFTESYSGIIKPEIVIIPEPTDNKLLMSFRGCVECDISIEGKSSHAARKNQGVNAIEEIILFYKNLENYIKSNDSTQLGFISSANLGHIEGGYKNEKGQIINRPNMVANIANATFDIRIGNNISQDEFENFCLSYFQKREQEIQKNGIINGVKLVKNDIKLWLGPLLQKDIEESYSNIGEINPGFTNGYSDIQLIKNEIGGDCIQVGPSPNDKCHQGDEFVLISSLYKTKEQICNLLGLETGN